MAKTKEKPNDEEKINTQTESLQAETDSGNVVNDDGNYDFGKTFEQMQNEKPKDETPPLDVDAILAEYVPEKKTRKPRTKKEKEPETQEIIFPGELIIHVSDSLMVGGIGWLDTFLSKKPIDANLLSLNDKQREQLLPSANAVSAELSKHIKANPVTAFFAMLGGMYVSNYLLIRALMLQAERIKDENRG